MATKRKRKSRAKVKSAEVQEFKKVLKAGEKETTTHPSKDDVAEATHPAEVSTDKKSGNKVFDHGMGHSSIHGGKKKQSLAIEY